MNNPFLFGVATSGEWFTDREEDTKRLVANFTYGVNTIIISPRRWGKTSLVLKAAKEVENKNVKVVMLDVFSCRSPEDFYRIFATEIIKQTASKWEEWVENTKRFLSNLTPKISFGNDPNAEFSFSIDLSDKKINEEILSLPQKIAREKGIKIVVCIDEFQQIAEFSDSVTFQKKMRGVWQLQTQDVSYCLFGSKKHLLNSLFSKQNMPFYKFGDIIFLQKIATEHWIKYIINRFEQTGKYISEELAEKICQIVENHSSYVQQLSWLVWVRTDFSATPNDIEMALKDLINQNSMLYYNYLEGFSMLQINFLSAVSDGVHDQFSRKEIITKYNLNSSASVVRIKKSLENKDIIDVLPRFISFNDPVFRLWFRKEIQNINLP